MSWDWLNAARGDYRGLALPQSCARKGCIIPVPYRFRARVESPGTRWDQTELGSGFNFNKYWAI